MKKSILSLMTILTVGLFISSCEFPELPNPEITLSQGFMTHVARVNFVKDASGEASGLLVEDFDKTKVTITGPDAARIYNIEGTKEFIITGGMVALLLDPSADFAGNKEYNINLVVEPAGYLKRIIPVKFIKDQNDSSYVVAMLKKSSMPAGITMATNSTGIVSAAGLGSTINLAASNAATSGVTTAITVPAGIKMKDASNTVLTGKLEAEVISFSETGNNTAYFPGGLNPENIDMGNGQTASGTFVSAGFASINMTVGGKKVKTFEGGKVAVKMTMSKLNYNAITEKPYKEDDTVDVWSYDDDKGQWKFEIKGIVKKDADNALYVSFETSHLSAFNLDCLFAGNEGRCFGAFTWSQFNTIKFDWTSSVTAVNCEVKFSYTGGQALGSWDQSFRSFNTTISKGQQFPVYNAPKATTRLDVYDTSTGKLLITKNFGKSEICSNPIVTLDVPNPPVSTVVTLKFAGMCLNKNTKVLPPVGTIIYYKETTTANWRTFYIVDYEKRNRTSLTTNLLTIGKSYDFKVVAGNKATQEKYTILKADNIIDFPIPDRICNAL